MSTPIRRPAPPRRPARPGAGLVLALALAALPSLAVAVPADEDRHLLVVSGLGGEDYYGGLFQRWSRSLLEVAEQRLGLDPARSTYLAESADVEGADGVARRAAVLRAIDELAAASRPGDRILIVLIGHGTAQGGDVRFNLPGPDLSPADLAEALLALDGRRLAVVNTSPSSGPFATALAAPGRVIIAATASGAEFQHTLFGGYFVDALAGTEADADKDRQVSLLEAFEYARHQVEQAYQADNRLQPEHAVLEDDGDGRASRAPRAAEGGGDGEPGDGALAAAFRFEPPAGLDAPADPQLRARRLALQVEARGLVDRVERLRRDKRLLAAADYERQLEALLVQLALNRRAWRAAVDG